MIHNRLVIVSMTSWPKRIGNVTIVLKSLVNQEVKADYIELNLSELEFPNHEGDLPTELNELVYGDKNNNICINWQPDNTKLFKKFIPALKKYQGCDYYMLTVDDDWIYRSDYIKIMIDYIELNKADVFCLSRGYVVGNRMIYRSGCFEPDFWEKIDDNVLSMKSDDIYIEHYLRSKKRKMDHNRPLDVMEITKEFNPCDPNSGNTVTGRYSMADIYRDQEIAMNIKFNG